MIYFRLIEFTFDRFWIYSISGDDTKWSENDSTNSNSDYGDEDGDEEDDEDEENDDDKNSLVKKVTRLLKGLLI